MSANESVRITLTGDEASDHQLAERNLEELNFDSQRNLIVDVISSLTSNVRERDRLKRDKSTHPLAHIKLSTKLESQIVMAYNHLDVLKTIYSRLSNSKRKRGKLTDNDMASYEDTINNLEENLLNLENTIRYRSSQTKSKANLDIKSVKFDKSSLTAQEQDFVAESIKKWNERDEQFDLDLKEIGESVDRIGQVAILIGTRAKEQAQTAIETVSQVENTTKGVSDVTLKIKKLLKRQRLVECYCRFFLIIIVLVLSGVLIYMIIRKLKK